MTSITPKKKQSRLAVNCDLGCKYILTSIGASGYDYIIRILLNKKPLR